MKAAWDTVQLGQACTLVNGRGFKPHEWRKAGLPIIRIQNLNGSDDFNYFDGEYDSKILVEPGQLLFAWSGSRGASFGPHIWTGPRGVLNYHTWRVEPAGGTDRDFLFQLLEMETVKIEASSHGASALVHVQKQEMEKRDIPLPPFPEQRKIAEILRTWDEAIEKLQALRAAKERRLDALRQQLLFPAEGDDNDVIRLGNVTTEETGRNGDGALGRETVMGVTNSRGVVPMRPETIAADIRRYKHFPHDAFAYNPMRINVGSIARNETDDTLLVSPDYVVFSCAPDGLLPGYLDHLRHTKWWLHHINSGGSGSVRQRTYYADLAALHLPIPGLNRQRAIVKTLETAKADVDGTSRMTDALTQQKRGLMQKLLTGEWRVKVAD